MGMLLNKSEFLAKNAAAHPAMLRRFGMKIERIVHDAHAGVTEKTPVWEGTALANMQWSMDHEDSEEFSAQGDGDPGHTNSMALGTEPRRGENQAFADMSLERLDYKVPFHRYILQNNGPHTLGLELGLLPFAPFTQRSPAGMFGVTFAEVVIRCEGGYYNVT